MRSQDPSDNPADSILDSPPGGVLSVDRAATITYLNAAARTLTLHRETTLGKPLTTPLGRAATEALHASMTSSPANRT